MGGSSHTCSSERTPPSHPRFTRGDIVVAGGGACSSCCPKAAGGSVASGAGAGVGVTVMGIPTTGDEDYTPHPRQQSMNRNGKAMAGSDCAKRMLC